MDKSDQEIILEYPRYSMYITRVIFHSTRDRKKEREKERIVSREKKYIFLYMQPGNIKGIDISERIRIDRGKDIKRSHINLHISWQYKIILLYTPGRVYTLCKYRVHNRSAILQPDRKSIHSRFNVE